MKKRCFIHIYILKLLLVKEIFSKYAYFDFKLACVDDYVKYIISSEGIIYPKNPKEEYDLDHIYNFETFKQDLDKKICFCIYNLCINKAYLSFQYASINEYIITIVNYENWYSCDDCDYKNNKKFMTSNDKCKKNNNPLILYSHGYNAPHMYTFCLKPKNDITNFYIDDNKINRNYYKGKTVEYFINNNTYNIPIKDLFSINGFDNLEIILDSFSLEISSIQNGKGKIFNGNEELFEKSFFNPNISLTFKKIINDGYLMTIRIKTKPRDRPSSVSTCVNEAQIYLYVSQENCTMDNASDNFCQKCIDEYGKYGNNCYHKSEKFTYLYYDEQSQTFKQCEINNNIYNCSICPEGTHIFKNYSFLNTCEKCPEWKYTDMIDQEECTPCQIPHCIECNTKDICLKCNNNALNGLGNCSVCKNYEEYVEEFCKSKCSKYFYRDNKNNIHCIQEFDECPEDMIYLNLETGECRKEVSDIEIIKGKYKLIDLEKKANELFIKVVNDKDLFSEIPENGIKIEGYNGIINMGIVNNDTIKTSSETLKLGGCPDLLRINLNINEPEQNLLYQSIDLKIKDDEKNINGKSIRFYNSELLDKPKDLSYCKNQNITYIHSFEEALQYIKGTKHGDDLLKYLEQGLDIFNSYSQIYNDPCYPLSTINKIDLTLNDRRNLMIKMNLSICRPGCLFEGVNYEKGEIHCFCKYYINTEEKSWSDGFTEGFKNLGKSKNIIVFKCINIVFNYESQKYNYIFEIILLFLIIEIICGFDCERGIKRYINNVIIFSLNNPEEYQDDSPNIVNYKQNSFQLISSCLKKIFGFSLLYFKENYDIANVFFFKNIDHYNEINITSIKIIIFLNSIILTLLSNTLFLDDEAMHNIIENNGKYNIIYRAPILIFSDLASWIICFLFFELPISFADLVGFKKDIRTHAKTGEFNTIIEKFKKKFKKIRIVIYSFSFIIIIISLYYMCCFFSIFQNTQVHLLTDFGAGLLMNLIISIVKSFLYSVCKYIYEYLCEGCKKVLNLLYKYFNKIKKFAIFIFEVLVEILVIYISKKSESFQNIQNLFD